MENISQYPPLHYSTILIAVLWGGCNIYHSKYSILSCISNWVNFQYRAGLAAVYSLRRIEYQALNFKLQLQYIYSTKTVFSEHLILNCNIWTQVEVGSGSGKNRTARSNGAEAKPAKTFAEELFAKIFVGQ